MAIDISEALAYLIVLFIASCNTLKILIPFIEEKTMALFTVELKLKWIVVAIVFAFSIKVKILP